MMGAGWKSYHDEMHGHETRTSPHRPSEPSRLLFTAGPSLPPMALPRIPINIDARGATINSVGQDQFNIGGVDLSTTYHNNGETTFNNTNNTNIYYVVSGDTAADGQLVR